MECPHCGHELIQGSAYGYLALHQSGEVLGYTYQCFKIDGFETEEEANCFMDKNGETLEDLGISSWEEVVCLSSQFGGHFHTNKQDDLIEGYPC